MHTLNVTVFFIKIYVCLIQQLCLIHANRQQICKCLTCLTAKFCLSHFLLAVTQTAALSPNFAAHMAVCHCALLQFFFFFCLQLTISENVNSIPGFGTKFLRTKKDFFFCILVLFPPQAPSLCSAGEGLHTDFLHEVLVSIESIRLFMGGQTIFTVLVFLIINRHGEFNRKKR